MPVRSGVKRESVIERATCDWARANGFLVTKIKAARGWPDRLFLFKGKAIFIEFKASSGGRLSEYQRHVINQIEDHGVPVLVANDEGEAIRWLKQFMKGKSV